MTQPFFQTGNAVHEDSLAVLFHIPNSQENWVYSVFIGLLDMMANPANWYTAGETTPEEAAQIFLEILWGREMTLLTVGMISWFAAPPSANWKLCDGTIYDKTVDVDLWNAIGDTFNTGGEPPNGFRVPDLRGRVIAMTNNGSGRLPAFADTLGGTGGESEHTLTESEMPSHSHTNLPHAHSEVAAVPTLINGGLEAPAAAATPTPATTGLAGVSIDNTGGDGAHNNVQPTMVLSAWILAIA